MKGGGRARQSSNQQVTSEDLGEQTKRSRLALDQLPYVPGALGLVWSGARGRTIAWGVLLILPGVLPAATASLTRLLVDNLVGVVGVGDVWESLRHALIPAALMRGLMPLNQLLGSVASLVRATQADLVHDHITNLIHRKSVVVDLAFYDFPECWGHLHRARLEGGHRNVALLESIASLVQNGLTLTPMAGLLVAYGAWLPVVLLLGALPALGVALPHHLWRYRRRRRTVKDERRAWCYYWLLTARETADEIRLFGLGGHFRQRYQRLRKRLRVERLRMTRAKDLPSWGLVRWASSRLARQWPGRWGRVC